MTDREFRDHRLTEQRNPGSIGIDIASPEEIVDLMHGEDKSVAAAVYTCRTSIARAISLAEDALRGGGRIIYVGAGTSGRLGVLDASECPPTFGVSPEKVVGMIAGGRDALVRSQEGAEDDEEQAIADLAACAVGEGDVVVGIAASGSTRYVRATLHESRKRGSSTVLVTCATPPEEVRNLCDSLIEVRVGPEVLTGSTRLKAGTATKMVLNMISTGAMVRLGKAYGNLMVDLMATSDKLVDRGQRIVMEACGVDRSTAKRAIYDAGGSVKLAVVMVALGVDAAAARISLDESGGIVRDVIGPPPPVGG